MCTFVDCHDLPLKPREKKDDGIILKLGFIPLIYIHMFALALLSML